MSGFHWDWAFAWSIVPDLAQGVVVTVIATAAGSALAFALGLAWTFVRIGPRPYLREPITVAAIEGSVAVLTQGPAPGSSVVTLGAPELLGAEYNISGEE